MASVINATAVTAAITGVITVALVISFILSWPVYMLWNNCLVGSIDGVNTIDWLDAWGVLILSGFLFKSTPPTKN